MPLSNHSRKGEGKRAWYLRRNLAKYGTGNAQGAKTLRARKEKEAARKKNATAAKAFLDRLKGKPSA